MLDSLAANLPLHWLRPWALWGLLTALVLLAWGRRTGGGAVPRGVIDEALLPHLLVHGGRAGWLRPGDTLAAAVACFSVALAGPAWQREAAPLALEQAPLMVVLDLSEAMDAADLPPSRLDRARAHGRPRPRASRAGAARPGRRPPRRRGNGPAAPASAPG